MDHRYAHLGYTPPAQGHDLRHQVSDISDNGYDGIRGRESIVSLQSRYGSPPPPFVASPPEGDPTQAHPDPQSWSTPFRRPSARGYTPLARPNAPSQRGPLKSFSARAQETIHEDESFDMSLLRSAAPPAEALYDPHPPLAASGPLDEPVYDMTSFDGPMGAQDHEFLQNLQKQEASGHLTGGLGLGMAPNTVL